MNKGLIAVSMVAIIAAVALFAMEDSSSSAFQQWKNQYGANWNAEEEFYRRSIFERNLQLLENHNADASQTYKMGINEFSVLTDQEFAATYLSGVIIPADVKPVEEEELSTPIVGDVDWVSKGGVSRVKNQGSCGSCWAFSATGVIESVRKIQGSNLDLSEQQLVDCSRPQGNQGCNGGWPSSALNYVRANGIASES